MKRLHEDGDGGGGGSGGGGYEGFSGGMGGMGMGGHSFSSDLMYKTFLGGWVDLFDTATSAAKSTISSAITNLKVVLEFVADSVIPWYRADYKKIFDRHHAAQDKIEQKYAAVYDNIKKNLVTNHDFMVSAIMFDPSKFFKVALSNPATFVTAVAAIETPNALVKSLDFLTGGQLGLAVEKKYGKRGDSIKASIKKLVEPETYRSIFIGNDSDRANAYAARDSAYESRGGRLGRLIFEREGNEDKTDNKQEIMAKLAKALITPEVIELILKNPEFVQASNETRKLTQQTLEQVVEKARSVDKINNIQDLMKLAGESGKKLPEIRDEDAKQVIERLRSSVKTMYAKMLTAEAQHLAKTVGKDHALTQAYIAAIQEIKS